jgi:hypothetical protein
MAGTGNLGGVFMPFSWQEFCAQCEGRAIDPNKVIEFLLTTRVGNTEHLTGESRKNAGFAYVGVISTLNKADLPGTIDIIVRDAAGYKYVLTAGGC